MEKAESLFSASQTIFLFQIRNYMFKLDKLEYIERSYNPFRYLPWVMQMLALLADALIEIQEQHLDDDDEVASFITCCLDPDYWLLELKGLNQLCIRIVTGKKFKLGMWKLIKICFIHCVLHHLADRHTNILKQWKKYLTRFERNKITFLLFTNICVLFFIFLTYSFFFLIYIFPGFLVKLGWKFQGSRGWLWRWPTKCYGSPQSGVYGSKVSVFHKYCWCQAFSIILTTWLPLTD